MVSPSSAPREDAVLGEVLMNDNLLSGGLRPGEADEDYALAKILQEQERAFLMLGRSGVNGPGENYPPAGAASGSGMAGRGEGGGEGEEEELDDEELARRLQEEEDAEHYRQMLAMAGVVPGDEEDEQEFEDDPVDPDNMTYEELTALGEAVGTVSKGITAEQIAALPVRRYCEVADPATACSDEQCTVCRLEFEHEDEVQVLPCKHYYHPQCVGEWLKHNKICPVCSKEVVQCKHG